MAMIRLALRNLRRRGWYFRITVGILVVAVLCLLASLGVLRGVEARIDLIDQANLRRISYIEDLPNMEVERQLLDRLAREEGIVGIAEVGSTSIHLGAPYAESLIRLQAVNRDAAELLSPRITRGSWLSDVDWDALTGVDRDELLAGVIPIVVKEGVARVGDIIQGYMDSDPVTARVVGTFDPTSVYFTTGTTLLPRIDGEGFIPMVAGIGVPSVRPGGAFEWWGVHQKWEFIIAASPNVLRANEQRWTQLLNEELERLGVRHEVRIVTMDDWEDSYRRLLRDEIIVAAWITGIVVALTVFGFGSINAVSIWDRGVEFGTYFATGATRRGVVTVALLEMLLPLVIPLLVGLAAWRWGNVWHLVMIDGVVVLRSLGVLAAIGLVSILGPLFMLKRTQPAMLIRGGYR